MTVRDCTLNIHTKDIHEGMRVMLEAVPPTGQPPYPPIYTYEWKMDGKPLDGEKIDPDARELMWDTTGLTLGNHTLEVEGKLKPGVGGHPDELLGKEIAVVGPRGVASGSALAVTMERALDTATDDLALWVTIRKSTEALDFQRYSDFISLVLCDEPASERIGHDEKKMRARYTSLQRRRSLPFNDTDAYRLLKVATEAFLVVSCGVPLANRSFDEHDLKHLLENSCTDGKVNLEKLWQRYLVKINGTDELTLPYLALIAKKFPDEGFKATLGAEIDGEQDRAWGQHCFGLLRNKLLEPCFIELIWCYWYEEAMLTQTINVIKRRFQNVRSPLGNDPLANLEIDPLRPLNNLIWSLINDEQHWLTLPRRAYEYDHEYGMSLTGKAVPNLRPADSRSRFLEAFHTLLRIAHQFFQQDDQTTVVADAFPALNALRQVHMILSEGGSNQIGDMPTMARMEMLMEQWLLARPEFREYLPTRTMIAYPEPWMDRVDAMKRLQGWTDVSVIHFRDLARYGEQIVLSIRYGAWSDTNDPMRAKGWLRYWRPEIQAYAHAYRAATGVDLIAPDRPVDATPPSLLLSSRLQKQLAAVR
ncbi:hypothetical protein LMG27952_05836 [Paraburkholderia hiiakae]|uniref:Uncharacterized protein n=1 Tax=Paraburkholderia hiiakae TaxID=1081782 RepID=A0ABN7IB09_9BURK|nr:8-amino-7-oxononanoate synthase [Paraburkholderia hiiakae]CAD6555544.1 hypothetical protein LMG27952_05836 [Paraburkholderia hiiakae]